MNAEIKSTLPKIYSCELIDLLFHVYYRKIIYIQDGLAVTRKTAASYLDSLGHHDFLVSEKIGKE